MVAIVLTWTVRRSLVAALLLSLGLGLVMPPAAIAQTGTMGPSPSTVLAPSSPSTASPSTASVKATPFAAPAPAAPIPAPVIDRAEVIGYLSAVIGWYRQIDTEVRLSSEPEETLFVADDRRMAEEVIRQAFAFAHAAALLLEDDAREASEPDTNPSTRVTGGAVLDTPVKSQALGDLIGHRDQMRTLLEELRAATSELRRQLPGANRHTRDAITRETAARQAQINLVESRIASFDTLIDFEKGTVATRASPLGLDAQIDELERSVAQATGAVPSALAPTATAGGSILPGNVERLLALRQKEQALGSVIALTDNQAQAVAVLRDKLIGMLAAIDHEGLAQTAQVGVEDLPTVKRTKALFEELVARSKVISKALDPLAKQIVLLQLYAGNLARWRTSVHQRFNDALRHQLFRVASLALVFGVVFAAAALWRRLTFRYIEDLQRRHKVLQLRRLALIAALVLVMVFGFASELSTLATVMGFAAAGIALALQNVILSLAGYFYLSGRFGIRIGDRVQIAGITGDVLESGFFKLTLMELGGDERGRLPTGRAVVFPNSVVFQPNSNLFRQLPGTSFIWNELRLTLAPDCDYRQAEKLVTEVVNEVFARYRDTVQREYRALESELNLRIETPRPQSRLQFGPAGLELVLRYPTRLTGAVQTADEITRRLVDAIQREPGLKLAVLGVPAIQAAGAARPDPPAEPRKA